MRLFSIQPLYKALHPAPVILLVPDFIFDLELNIIAIKVVKT